MNKSSSTPKGNFLPPIKTAVSFLRTICKSPDYSSIPSPLSPRPEMPSDFSQSDRKPKNNIKSSTNLNIRNTISREYRDSQNLNKILRTSEPDQKVQNSFYLPTSIEKLKNLAKVGKDLGKNIKIRVTPCEPTVSEWKLNENSFEERLGKVNKRRASESSQLKDWLEFMKNKYLTGETEESKDSKKFKVVLNVALQEIFKTLGESSDLGVVVKEFVGLVKVYGKMKSEEKNKRLVEQVAVLEQSNEMMKEEIRKVREEGKEVRESNSQEISVLKSNLLVKQIEIDGLSDSIRLLKADRTYRMKKDLEKINKIVYEFCDYVQYSSDSVDEKKVNKKEESLKGLILRKLGILKEKSQSDGYRLTEEQLIEHEMLMMNVDSLFLHKEVQADIHKSSVSKATFIRVDTSDQAVLTDEILDFIEEQESEDLHELLKQPTITILNENQEEIQYSNYSKSLINISMKSEDDEAISPNLSPTKTLRRINSLYKWREFSSVSTQTDEQVFQQVARQQEEEILDWMINDRKSYLSTIQKQIFQKKNELSRVNSLVHHSRSLLNESPERIKRQNSSLSCEENEDFIESEISHLMAIGILDKDIEIESWKNGFIYGYEKAKSLVEDEKTDEEKKEEAKNPEEIEDEQAGNRPFIRTKINAVKTGTKIQEFHFQNQNKKRKNSKAPGEALDMEIFIRGFLQESSKFIMKQAKMSRKMTIKTVTSLINASLSRKSDLPAVDLFNFTYEEFCARYGPQIVNKKLIEFFASVLKYPDSRKTVNFAKLLGIGKKIGLEDYARPKETFSFLIELMNLLQKSNLGIVFNVEEKFEYEFIPVIRAVECTKEVLVNFFESGKISEIIAMIENNSHPDPKKINKCGLIDQEFLIEMIIGEIDKYYAQALKAIWDILHALYRSKSIGKVFRQDLIICIQYISPDKFSAIFGLPNNSLDPSDQEPNLSEEDFTTFCLSNKVLTPKDLTKFLKDSDSISSRIQSEQTVLKSRMSTIFEHKSQLSLSEKYSIEWEKRFESATTNQDLPNNEKSIIWQILSQEIAKHEKHLKLS